MPGHSYIKRLQLEQRIELKILADPTFSILQEAMGEEAGHDPLRRPRRPGRTLHAPLRRANGQLTRPGWKWPGRLAHARRR